MGCETKVLNLARQTTRPPESALARRAAPQPDRAFDPTVVARVECEAWVAYYRRDWPAFLRAGLILSRRTFGLSWIATIWCSWLVLQANRLWAPFPNNDPDRAWRAMERVYRFVQRRYAEPFDPARAATLEVEWWRVHREIQHSGARRNDRALADALARLYAHVYNLPETVVRAAADQRALAMRHSDQWVSEGCKPDSALIDSVHAALLCCYTTLLAAVQPSGRVTGLPAPC
jgi:hypothetical protein